MSDLLEHQLHAAFATKLGSVSPAVIARVCAADYNPKQYSRSPIPLLSGAITTIAACAVAAVLLFSSGATSAFAGWTARPTPASAAEIGQARATCGHVPAGSVVTGEARGPFVAIIYVRSSSPWVCITHGDSLFLDQTTPNSPGVFANPGSGKVTLPVVLASTAHGGGQAQLDAIRKREVQLDHHETALQQHHRAHTTAEVRALTRTQQSLELQRASVVTGPDSLTAVTGAVGTGVTGVNFVLADGTHVTATVRHNWYLAWWPGVATHNAYPTSIQVTTHADTTTTRYGPKKLRALFAGCQLPKVLVCGVTRIKLIPGIAPALKQHFNIFRTTPPASGQLLRELEPGAWSVDIGADIPQLRAISFGRHGTVIAIPGTAGICVEIARFDRDQSGLARADRLATEGRPNRFPDDEGTCFQYTHGQYRDPFNIGIVMSQRVEAGYGTRTYPSTYTVLGIVPDGNRSVTVHLKSGQAVRLRIKQNIVLRSFTLQPTDITYKNAAGQLISRRLGF